MRIKGVEVIATDNDEGLTYSQADRWTVDEGYLHLIGPGSSGKTATLATYSPGCWRLARFVYNSH